VAYVSAVSATYYTDPYSPWCWGAEPSVRRLQVEFGDEVALTFVIVGLAGRLEQPGALALAGLDAAEATGMPLDPRVFLRDPPRSTHPAGIAVAAAAEQHGGARVGAYLRRLREAIHLEGRRMDAGDALLDAARETGGLDVERLRVGFGSSGVLEAFGAHMERARAVDAEHREPGTDRVRIPSIEFRGADGSVHAVYGYAGWDAWRAAAVAAGAEPVGGAAPEPVAAIARFGTMATPEVAAVCDLPGPRAPAELWRLAMEWRVRPRRVLGGEVWAAA
jgi:predicted DsbA family dithiol-disulfide isomerase